MEVYNRKTKELILVLLFFSLVAGFSCAYFNTLYNAKKLYKQAEDMRGKVTNERELRDKYKEVIKKCATLITTYPKSRYVPEAMFLMGKALVRQNEYDKAIRKFYELATNYPKSKYIPESVYWTALAYYEKGDYNQAITYVTRFLKDYPKSKIRAQVLLLAGDIAKELGKYDDSLDFYGRLAEESSDRDLVNRAIAKSADLFFEKGEWDKAAANYEKLLKKGIPWKERYKISLSLGKCYLSMGECEKALALYNDLLARVTLMKEKPPLKLGQASSYLCMDSLKTAIKIYEKVTHEFPRSLYSAEAYYRIGTIYHEKLDSLQRAQEAFEMVAKEYASSEFAQAALQKSNSIKKLMELEKASGGDNDRDREAEKRFLSAEIQLTRLDDVDAAINNYEAVVDSFADTKFAPKAAFALGWIFENKMEDTTRAVGSYEKLIRLFPRSPQALGAIERLRSFGLDSLAGTLSAYVDSALADTSSVRADTSAAAESDLEGGGSSTVDVFKGPAGEVNAASDSTAEAVEADSTLGKGNRIEKE